MSEILEAFAARAAGQRRVGEWVAHTGVAFALEKRKLDAEQALGYMEGHAKTELINALRTIGQQLRP